MNWLCTRPPAPGETVTVRIRSRHVPAAATIEHAADHVWLRFTEPQAAVAPGQLAVLYRGDRVLGGAPNERALPAA